MHYFKGEKLLFYVNEIILVLIIIMSYINMCFEHKMAESQNIFELEKSSAGLCFSMKKNQVMILKIGVSV